MIAGAPLSRDGCRVLAALLRLKGGPQLLGSALQERLEALEEEEPQRALAEALAERPLSHPGGRPWGQGRAAAARFLRRLGRRARVLQADPGPCPAWSGTGARKRALKWLESSSDPDQRRARRALIPVNLL